MKKVIVEFRGKRYRLCGWYTRSIPGRGIAPDSPARFSVSMIEQIDGDNAPLGFLLERDEIDALALRTYEENLAWAAQESADKQRLMMKETA